MVRLTAEELDIVMRAAHPLAYGRRDAFLQDVATELARCNGDVGPGVVHRICRDVQKRHFDFPALDGVYSKYR